MPTATARSQIAAALALALGTEAGAGADGSEAELIAEAARLQEVGKIYTPANLLYLPESELDGEARAEAESFFERGHALARGAGVPDRACDWILAARERWDGSGPTGLAGADIPLGARVIAVCREYLDAPQAAGAGPGTDPRAAAIERLRSLAGTVLDPGLATLAAELAAPAAAVVVRDRTEADRAMVEAILAERNGTTVARNHELVDPLAGPMLLAFAGDEFAGSLAWIDDGTEVEILQLFALDRHRGVGTHLVEAVAARAAALGRTRLYVVTTNDNIDALRFYQRRGFRLRALRPKALEYARARLKPSIPSAGDYGIYKRDELELERDL